MSKENGKWPLPFKHYVEKDGNVRIPYLVHGNEPKFAVMSVFHGDEIGALGSLARALNRYRQYLKSYLYIPIASVSAAMLKTEANFWQHDVNWSFMDDTTDPEALALKRIFQRFTQIETVISGHEDEEFPHYLYHRGEPDPYFDIDRYRAAIRRHDIRLHTGIDDFNHPYLGLWIDDGYNFKRTEPTNLSFDSWALRHHIKRVYTLEVPMFAPILIKDLICSIALDHLIGNNPTFVKQNLA